MNLAGQAAYMISGVGLHESIKLQFKINPASLKHA